MPAFAPVRSRARRDGWHPLRQAEFVGALAETGSVSAAARRVGMVQPVMHAGRCVGVAHKPDNSSLLRLVRWFGRAREGVWTNSLPGHETGATRQNANAHKRQLATGRAMERAEAAAGGLRWD